MVLSSLSAILTLPAKPYSVVINMESVGATGLVGPLYPRGVVSEDDLSKSLNYSAAIKARQGLDGVILNSLPEHVVKLLPYGGC